MEHPNEKAPDLVPYVALHLETSAPLKEALAELSPTPILTRKVAREYRSKRAKRWAWRVTGLWYWIHAAAYVFSFREALNRSEGWLISNLGRIASHIGFSPSNAGISAKVMRWIWLLVICNFSLTQLIGFFTLYLPCFPVMALLWLFLRKAIGTQLHARVDNGLSLNREQQIPLTVASASFLVAWFLLYGDSLNHVVKYLGAVLCGVLFLTRIVAAFRYARPADDIKSVILDRTINIANQQLAEQIQKINNGGYTKRIEVAFPFFVQKAIYKFLRRIAVATRGSRGRSRIAILVLAQYASNLVVLGALAVLFWGLTFKAASLQPSSLQDALLASASRVIPGLSVSSSLTIPISFSIASALSGWFLFVIYAGPAASVFPAIQQTYINAAIKYHKLIRPFSALLRIHIKILQHLHDKLPS